MLVSDEQQSESVVDTFIQDSFLIEYHRILSFQCHTVGPYWLSVLYTDRQFIYTDTLVCVCIPASDLCPPPLA